MNLSYILIGYLNETRSILKKEMETLRINISDESMNKQKLQELYNTIYNNITNINKEYININLNIAKMINLFNEEYDKIMKNEKFEMLCIDIGNQTHMGTYYSIDFDATSGVSNCQTLKLIDKDMLHNVFKELKFDKKSLDNLFSIEIGFQASGFVVVSVDSDNKKMVRLSRIKMI